MHVEVTLLVAGSCRHLEYVSVRGGRWRAVTFPSLVAVLRHPTLGVVLYDAGYSPQFFTATARLPYALYRWTTPVQIAPEDTAAAQLAASGIDPSEISLIIVSHFHADHVAGLGDFPRARFLHLKAALDGPRRARSALGRVRCGFLPGLMPEGFDARTEHVEDRPPTAVPAMGDLAQGFDLLGDGSVVGLDLPGHVSGHLGLLIEHTQGPPLLLVGDAVWNRRAFTHGDLPHPVTRLITDDPRAYRRTAEALQRLHRERQDLLIVPSHCEESIALARTALAGVGSVKD
jgi:glyoxylase-like metal-dependent hydrolase (beta-lactamase superfamily II)